MKIIFTIIAIASIAILISGYWQLFAAIIPILIISAIANAIIKNQNRIYREYQIDQAKREINDLEQELNSRENRP